MNNDIKTKMVSVILPTFNEKGNIVPIIDTIHQELAEYKHEIVVVDDNSTDGTQEAITGLNYPFIKLYIRKQDPGLAKSIRYGLEQATGDIFVIMDSDFNHQPQYIPFMVQSLSHFDCVVGSRFLYGGRGADTSRHLLSWSFNLFLRILTDGRITDSLYGYVAVHRGIMERLDYDRIFWGFGDYCIRFIYYLQKQKAAILQIPSVFGKRVAGEGNKRFLKVFFQYTITVLKLVMKEGRLKFKKSDPLM
jgi:dolichol-phosphate mannosyltransferase